MQNVAGTLKAGTFCTKLRLSYHSLEDIFCSFWERLPINLCFTFSAKLLKAF